MEKMQEKIKQRVKRGKWLENMTKWSYSPEFLIERGLVYPLKGRWLTDTSEERTFTLSMPMSPELMDKIPEARRVYYIDQCNTMRLSFIQWLNEIPKMIDKEKQQIRWPMKLVFSYSGSGQQIQITLSSHYVELEY
jgi:hypothetical protein